VACPPAPRKGLIGPWSHAFPQDGEPGPAIGFLQECLRWFDHWLKGIDNGVMDGPGLRAWIQEPVAPATHFKERPGRWVSWSDTRPWAWDFGPPAPVSHHSVESTGLDAGAWCADGGEGDWPGDQRAEDERSLAFTSAPLDGDVEILGFGTVDLTLEVDRPNALVAVRLCDVAPDGSSLLVTRGVLNLRDRGGPDVAVQLDAIGQRVPAGHRLRVGISTAYWPWVWPSPEPVTVTLHAGRLTLPTREPGGEDQPDFGPPEWAAPLEVETITPGATTRSRTDRDREHVLRFEWDVGGHRRLRDGGIEMDDTHVTTYRIVDGDPLSARVTVECSSALGRGSWRTRVQTHSEMTATAAELVVEQRLDAYEGDERIASRSWTLRFPRDGV
jgi:uncharacterized protein